MSQEERLYAIVGAIEAAEPCGQAWFLLVEIFTAELKAHVDEIPPSAPARQ